MGFFIAVLFILALIALVKASTAQANAAGLLNRIDALERKLRNLENASRAAAFTPPPVPVAKPQPDVPMEQVPFVPPPMSPRAGVQMESEPPVAEPAPASQAFSKALPFAARAATPQPAFHTPPPVPRPAVPPSQPRDPINWEQFMGAKLFAWIGGIALFLGIAFFVKYSFEHNLIPPALRVTIGFIAGLGLVGGGLMMKRKETAVTAQTLSSTGVLVLYGVTFACRSLYHFPAFSQAVTFLIMSLITAGAFLLSVRMNAMAVAVLGIAGGFLTPVLLSTGQDAPLALFGYIALLDIGLLAVALRMQWAPLPVLGLTGTLLMQFGWVVKFFDAEKYFAGGKIFTVFAVFLFFEGLYIAATAAAKKRPALLRIFTACSLALALVSLAITFFFLSYDVLAARPVALFGYAFAVDAGIVVLVLIDGWAAAALGFAGGLMFALLAVWTRQYLTQAHLYIALGFYFVFGLFHSAVPVALHKVRGLALSAWNNAFPALALVLVLIPILTLPSVSIFIWPMVLVVDILAIALGLLTATAIPILIVLLLTLVALGSWFLRIPEDLTGFAASIWTLGGFSIFFIIAAAFACRILARKLPAQTRTPELFGDFTDPSNLSIQIPVLSSVLPFLLLIMVTLRLPLADPTPVFALAMVLVLILMGLAWGMSLEVLPAVGLVSVAALEACWHTTRFNSGSTMLPFAWYAGFYFVFTVFPFLFHWKFEKTWLSWATAALAGVPQFCLVYDIARRSWPFFEDRLGLVPAAFAVAPLLGFAFLRVRTPSDRLARNTQLAWMGAIALLFITLIFPIQFHRQWLTLGWALEGMALCWLFRRVPHKGLYAAALGLLVAVFLRLAVNPMVLAYYPKSQMPIFNWYLYTYGIVAAANFIAARMLAPAKLPPGNNPQPLFNGMGTILLFLLVNIEIADYYTAPGSETLAFEFSGNFGRDMCYSIAWGLFALVLLVIGLMRRQAPVRWGSIGLLAVTLIKLFFHDLWQLGPLYRIAAFIVVAIIAIAASFLYQRFMGSVKDDTGNASPPAV